jgi:hypothetical protein
MKGDRVPLVLTRPLVVDGITLLPIGAQAYGVVTKAKKGGPNCTQGFIKWEVDQVRFGDASSAVTEIYTTAPWPDTPVPELVDSSEVRRGRHDDLKALPEIVVFTPPLFAAYIIYALFHPRSTGCTGNGSDNVFPAGSTVGVVVAKKHGVRY